MKILITGGAGFIGSNYAHYRFENYPQDEIFVLDKLTYAGNLDNLSDLIDQKRFHFVQGDIADRPFIEQLFEKERFDKVVNFAAETHVDRSITGPDIFVQTNIVGTHNLLMAARLNEGKRYHQVSTDEVYGDLGTDSTELFTEESPIKPNCPYAASKASADLLVSSYFETYKMPATISRCSNNYGPYQHPEKLIPYSITRLMEGKPIAIYGDGKYVRDWIHVDDHCSALAHALLKGVPGEVYNIGADDEIDNLTLAKRMLAYFKKDTPAIIFVKDRPGHDRRYAIDASKIRKELGWKPQHSLRTSFESTIAWYVENTRWMWRALVRAGVANTHI